MPLKAPPVRKNEKDLHQRQLDVSSSIRTIRLSLNSEGRRAAERDRCGAAIASAQNGDGLEAGAAAYPEYRTPPMVWYVPPLSPISLPPTRVSWAATVALPDVDSLRIPFGAVPGEPVDRWRHLSRRTSVPGKFETDAGDASLQTCGNRRRCKVDTAR